MPSREKKKKGRSLLENWINRRPKLGNFDRFRFINKNFFGQKILLKIKVAKCQMRSTCKISDWLEKKQKTFINSVFWEITLLIKVPGFLSDQSEILHVLLIWHLATFILSKNICPKKFLLIKLFKYFQWIDVQSVQFPSNMLLLGSYMIFPKRDEQHQK